ncbi:YhgE/Pip family protein [Janibacter sp. GXQ6167]|uniref:YhgE/Pip family protein n=1 Tax=Janibacter sp. GXQ6167 TaxID=3240791 RepID=UPI003524FA1C
MNPIRLAMSELLRLTSSRLARLALLAVMLIPTLYGGLYLYANHDPYAALPDLPTAIVDEDAGTTLATGEELQVGDDVAKNLIESKTFDWHQVNRSEALAGVEDGTYAFAVIVPAHFSEDIASSAEYKPRQATIELETNDTNGYLTSTIANQVIKEVTTSVASKISETAASQLLLGFTRVHDEMDTAIDGAKQLHDATVKAHDGAGKLKDGAQELNTGLGTLRNGARDLHAGTTEAAKGGRQLDSGARQLANGLTTLDQKTASLPSQTRQLADGSRKVADANGKISQKADAIADVAQDLDNKITDERKKLIKTLRDQGLDDDQIKAVEARLDRIDGHVQDANTTIQSTAKDLDTLAAGADQVADGNKKLADSVPALRDGIVSARKGAGTLSSGAHTLSTGLNQLDAGAGRLATGANDAYNGSTELAKGTRSLYSGLGELSDGAKDLHDGLVKGQDEIPNPTDEQRKAVAQTIGNPLKTESDAIATAGSYGAGLAPFFMSLALWIGGYVLFLIVRPLSTRALATSQWSLRTALGGYLPPVAVGIGQSLLLLGIVAWGVGIDVAHPLWALLFMFFVSMTFIAILHALVSSFGAVGKFLGLVFMVIQLVSGGGTFPWQTLPEPLQFVHHIVPMSYAIDGLRRLMYGGDMLHLTTDIAVLLAYLIGALALSTIAARKARIWTPARIKPEFTL